MASEILCTRWTMVLLCELVAGSTRFNELRRGVPRMSPALLSKRLSELEAAGIVQRERLTGSPEVNAFRLTQSGLDLRTMTEVWMGLRAAWEAIDGSALLLIGDRETADAMQSWLGRSSLARQEKPAS